MTFLEMRFMNGDGRAAGHLAALFTVVVWGTTFVASKVLLERFTPLEILFYRFVLGFVILTIICPRRLRGTTLAQELTFAAAGLCGVCLYFLLETIALTYTMASNVGVILSTSPFFIAILSRLFLGEALRGRFFVGFVFAITGVGLISFNGVRLELNPMGDLLSVGAALSWGVYSLLTRRIGSFGLNVIQTTQRIFLYGLLCLAGSLLFIEARFSPARLAEPIGFLNIAYLGVGASALCFVTWNFAVKVLGPVRTGVYLYLAPVVTVTASALILSERVTAMAALGTCLILIGLALSEWEGRRARPLPQTAQGDKDEMSV